MKRVRIRLALGLALTVGLMLLPGPAWGGHAFRRGSHAGVFVGHGHLVGHHHGHAFVHHHHFIHHGHPFVHHHFIHPGFIHSRVWVPGFWHWNGLAWIWVPGRWAGAW